MVRATGIATKTNVTTTVKTHARVTLARVGFITFVIEGFGTDAADKKVIAELYRGSSGGTPGSDLTLEKLDSTEETPSLVATVDDVFSSEAGYSAGDLLQRPTFHPQSNRQSITVRGITGEVFDLRLTQDTSGTGVYCQVTTYVQG